MKGALLNLGIIMNLHRGAGARPGQNKENMLHGLWDTLGYSLPGTSAEVVIEQLQESRILYCKHTSLVSVFHFGTHKLADDAYWEWVKYNKYTIS